MDIPPLCSASPAISTSSLISTLHQTFSHSQYRCLRLDSTSLLAFGPNIEESYIFGIWDHAYRRSEDQTLIVLPTHNSASTSFFSAVSAFPNVNPAVLQALNVLTPFFTALTPENLSSRFHNGLGVSFSLNSQGQILSTRINLADNPLSSIDQLLKLPSNSANRAFDVFYHLILSEAESHGEYLSLKSSLEEYDLLNKSGTYNLPDWVLFSDDYALAKDWSSSLKQCNIKGATLRGILSTLSGILLLGNANSKDVAEGASLIGIDPTTFKKHSIESLITSSYISLIDSVFEELNKFLSDFDLFSNEPVLEDQEDPNEIVSVVTIVEGNSSLHRKIVLKNVFDDAVGINNELKEDGVNINKSPNTVLKSIKTQYAVNQKSIPHTIPNFTSILTASVSYLAQAAPKSKVVDADSSERPLDLEAIIAVSRIWTVINFSSSSDAASLSNDAWSSQVVSAQIREQFITEWATKRRKIDFTTDFDFYEFLEKYSAILPPDVGVFNLGDWAINDKQWSPLDFCCGSARIWLSEAVWRDLEIGLDNVREGTSLLPYTESVQGFAPSDDFRGFQTSNPFDGANVIHDPTIRTLNSNTYSPRQVSPHGNVQDEQTPQLQNYGDQNGTGNLKENQGLLDRLSDDDDDRDSDFDNDDYYINEFKDDIEKEAGGKPIEVIPMTSERRSWVWFVWLLTFWIPSPMLKYLGGMKRPDVRMAWREKLVLFFLIGLLNCVIIFYMIFLGKIICPDFNKVWDINEVSEHHTDSNYFVAVHGKVYDLTKFHKVQHSDSVILTTSENMMQFAGMDLSDYFIPPLTVACNGLVEDVSLKMTLNTSLEYPEGDHTSGSYFVPNNNTALHNYTWYDDVFLPSMKGFYKGELVVKNKDVKTQASSDDRPWAIINNKIYDLTNYKSTIDMYPSSYSPTYEKYAFLDPGLYNLFQSSAGTDITEDVENLGWDRQTRIRNLNCLNNVFYAGMPDFRYSNRCQLSNIILLSIAVALSSVTVIKFVASLQFGSKPNPALQDKFVICQVPCYTEDEAAIRKAVDSLTALEYDNRRKLIVVICDGMITGSGNDKPTPRIVLDIFGVDPKVDPPTMPFLSVGEGSSQLNHGKIYSGLYEFEGDVVPFLVIVKIGKPSETSKPGNRGKRDSQVLLMNFLNRVHYQRPMCPLELEMFHHINNVIGVDPELYEYLFMVDADTSVAPDSLNRLVAACAKDSKIAGICGETSLQNEEKSISTMIQVYEYFISHHLTKAFESLFGSVTCLPGCFTMYRLRTAKKAKPLIISDSVIRDYSVGQVDTLHKKNLFSLGEDRYLTTLMSKYFSKMKYTFIPNAHAYTQAPDEFSVLLSQRRRWINSTLHNLVELLRLSNMCGFCCLSMRMVVFIDLIGTIMLPSVCVYLGYLIYVIASRSSPFPLISVIMIAAVYGLQALVFLLRKQWQHIVWMIIYILAYPVHSFILPIYSFWYMDNFSWGNTRVVVGEKNGKQIVAVDDEGFDPSMIPMETWSSFANRNGLEGAERMIVFDEYHGRIENVTGVFNEMQDFNNFKPRGHMNLVYSDDQYRLMSSVGMNNTTGMPNSSISGADPNPFASDYVNPRFSHFSELQSNNPSIIMGGNEQSRQQAAAPLDPEIEGKLVETIARVLRESDLDTTTKRQLREAVEDIMGMNFVGARITYVDKLIDEELEKLEDEDYE